MLSNINNDKIENEHAIIPLVSFHRSMSEFKCLGTAFIINPNGWFISAKHVLFTGNVLIAEMIFGIQTPANGNKISRQVSHLSVHPIADIVVGKFGIARDMRAREVTAEPFPAFRISMKPPAENDEIISFGYPRTGKIVKENETTFTFTGNWMTGIIKEFYPNGSPVVRNRCYHTTMHIESGSSGGPVFRDNLVIGINSSGWDLEEGMEPISFITPIDYIKDLTFAESNSKSLNYDELLALKHINVKDYEL